MQYIIDTHILIWFLLDDKKLPKEAKEIIQDEENEIYYSTASLWEIDIKHSKHPKATPFSSKEIADACLDANIENLPIFNKHIFQLNSIKTKKDSSKHEDLFDRIILAQAKRSGMMILTHGHMFKYYDENCIKIC